MGEREKSLLFELDPVQRRENEDFVEILKNG